MDPWVWQHCGFRPLWSKSGWETIEKFRCVQYQGVGGVELAWPTLWVLIISPHPTQPQNAFAIVCLVKALSDWLAFIQLFPYDLDCFSSQPQAPVVTLAGKWLSWCTNPHLDRKGSLVPSWHSHTHSWTLVDFSVKIRCAHDINHSLASTRANLDILTKRRESPDSDIRRIPTYIWGVLWCHWVTQSPLVS
jgi:hypothetical protein